MLKVWMLRGENEYIIVIDLFLCTKILAITDVTLLCTYKSNQQSKKKKRHGDKNKSKIKTSFVFSKFAEDLGMLTPLHTSTSIPILWEEEPGRPRPCTNLVPLPNSIKFNEPKLCLETHLRLYMESTKSSLTTVFLWALYYHKKMAWSVNGQNTTLAASLCFSSFCIKCLLH